MSLETDLIGTWLLNERITPIENSVLLVGDIETCDVKVSARRLSIVSTQPSNYNSRLLAGYLALKDGESGNSTFFVQYYKSSYTDWRTFGDVLIGNGIQKYRLETATTENRTFSIKSLDTTDEGTLNAVLGWLQQNAVKQLPKFTCFYRNPDSKLIGSGQFKFRPYTKLPPPAQPNVNNIVGTWVLNETISTFLSYKDCPSANGVFETINGTYKEIEFRDVGSDFGVIGFIDGTRTLGDFRFYTVLGVGDDYAGGPTGVAAVLSNIDGYRIVSTYAATVEARTIKIISIGEGDTYLFDKMLEWFQANATKTAD